MCSSSFRTSSTDNTTRATSRKQKNGPGQDTAGTGLTSVTKALLYVTLLALGALVSVLKRVTSAAVHFGYGKYFMRAPEL